MVWLCLYAKMECNPYLSLEVPLFESGILKAVHFSSSCSEENLFFFKLVSVRALVRFILLQRKEEGKTLQHPGHGLGS